MKIKSVVSIIGLGAILAILAGCAQSGDYYTLSKVEGEEDMRRVEMKPYDPKGEAFTFVFDKNIWAIEEWEEDRAINHVALVHRSFEGKCSILPGSLGEGLEQGTYVLDGIFKTPYYGARTLDIYNTIGIRLQHVVGFDVDGVGYIFEVRLPVESSAGASCANEALNVSSTFRLVKDLAETGAPETPSESELPKNPEAGDSSESTQSIDSSIPGESSTESVSEPTQ